MHLDLNSQRFSRWHLIHADPNWHIASKNITTKHTLSLFSEAQLCTFCHNFSIGLSNDSAYRRRGKFSVSLSLSQSFFLFNLICMSLSISYSHGLHLLDPLQLIFSHWHQRTFLYNAFILLIMKKTGTSWARPKCRLILGNPRSSSSL